MKASVLADASRRRMLSGELEEAIRSGREALAMAERLELPALRANALNNVGSARAALGDEGGIGDLEESVRIAEEANEAWDIVRGYINLAAH